MLVISHTTRTNWKQILTKEHHLDEDTASTLIGLIRGDPRLASARPQTRKELAQVGAQLEQILDEIEFSEFDGVDDQQALRDDLVEAVKFDLGLVEDPQQLITGAVKRTGAERERAVEALGFVAANKPDETFEGTTISQKYLDALIERVQETEGDERQRAAQALGEAIVVGASSPADLAAEQLRERVENTTGQAKQAAAQALGHLHTATAGEAPPQPDSADSIGNESALGATERGFAAEFRHDEEPTGEPPQRLQGPIEQYTEAIREGELDLEGLKEDFDVIVKWVEHRLENNNS